MAGDWTPIRKALFEDARTLKIATALSIDAEAVVGKLARVWLWAGDHTTNGHIAQSSLSVVDSVARAQGFAEAMKGAEWLEIGTDGSVTFPRWRIHNSKAAKQRLLAAARAAKKRARDRAQTSRSARDKSVPTEEKRTEQKRTEEYLFPEGLRSPEFAAKWAEWIVYRQERKFAKYTASSFRKAIKKCAELGAERSAIAIDHSIASNYQGMFEPKDNTHGRGQQRGNGAGERRNEKATREYPESIQLPIQ